MDQQLIDNAIKHWNSSVNVLQPVFLQKCVTVFLNMVYIYRLFMFVDSNFHEFKFNFNKPENLAFWLVGS